MRGFGALETAIMHRLWEQGTPATVREVLTDLREERELAYTTVLTVMDNLFKKGWLRREKAGKANRYAPVASREEYGATVMRAALDDGGDPRLTLLQFVSQMSPAQTRALRDALAAHGDSADS